MSIKTAAEQLAGPIGKEIGASDDHTQAALLNGFCEMLHMSTTRNAVQMQICWIADKLSPTTIEVLRDLVGFADGKAEARQ